MKNQSLKFKTQNSNPPSPSPSPARGEGSNISPPLRGGDKGEGDVCGFTISKRGCRRQGRYFKGRMGGFTLVELIVTMVLIGIVAFIVADAMSTGFKTYFTTDFRKEALDQARIAMERMTREIRNVRSFADIGTATASQFCYVNTDGTRVSFLYSANTIVRDEPAACPSAAVSPVLANNITSFSFSYLLTSGLPDGGAPSANTKRIRIIIASTVSGEVVTLQSEVWPRSL